MQNIDRFSDINFTNIEKKNFHGIELKNKY